MSPTTLSGAVKIAVWSTSMRCMSAFMRDAMNSCVFGCIIRSCFATRYQDGTLFHSGRGAFSWMQATLIGRCTAANRTFSSVEAFCANADANPESGIQMKPCGSGASCGACGWGARDRRLPRRSPLRRVPRPIRTPTRGRGRFWRSRSPRRRRRELPGRQGHWFVPGLGRAPGHRPRGRSMESARQWSSRPDFAEA